MEKGEKRRSELEFLILEKVGEVSSLIDCAKNVNEVICALHSLAIRLFAIDSSAIASSVDQRYRSPVLDAALPMKQDRDEWRHMFYHGAAFPAMARILIYNIASNWLACFPSSAKKQLYDSFFVQGPSSETIQALVPSLMRNGAVEESDYKAVFSNVERLLVLCLLKNEGARFMVGEFRFISRNKEHVDEALNPDKLKIISRAAQLLASIPDKARPDASSSLSSQNTADVLMKGNAKDTTTKNLGTVRKIYQPILNITDKSLFFRQIVTQLLAGIDEVATETNRITGSDITILDGSFLFVGETFSRISRRGSADILLLEMIPRIYNHVRNHLSTNTDSEFPSVFESKPNSQLWSKIMESIKDHYAVERLSEELLRQLAAENIKDTEAYWILWLLFHRTFKDQNAMRAMFVEKFLRWKVFPLCCLRWIIQFAVLECPPCAGTQMEGRKTKGFLDIVRCLAVVWSKSEFVQSTAMEQQAYITAALGLCLEKMSKEELETTKDVLHSILRGVSCRLESPIHLIRKMAGSIALVFSEVVDPKNPLYLEDDSCEKVDWEFGIIPQPKKTLAARIGATSHDDPESPSSKKENGMAADKREKGHTGKIAHDDTKSKESRLIDHGKRIIPVILTSEGFHDEEDDVESKVSEASDDSSLQPYDLSDDDTDLQKKVSQLADISVALRKPDDPDGVERALDVAEHLVRASPDELRHISGDLVRALVHVRCSDVTVEGKEDSAEGKRQKALIALLVTCPFESLDVITNLLYSPNVDVSQRILILDVMTEAAQELADTKIIQAKSQQRDLISNISDSQAWFIPTSRGPAGAGPWKEVSEAGTNLSWSHRYERELPSRPGQLKKGKSRRWCLGTKKESLELTKNTFPLYAAAFMLPVMQGFDKKRHGVDLLNRDFIVLGKLIYMLGVCMKCTAMHPEASALAPGLLDMLRSREVAHHAEAYVRRSVLFAASCILVALHPSYVASALIEGNQETSNGLEWIRTWALHIAESDTDTECSMMAMRCLQLHAEMALQTSRALESANSSRPRINALPSKINDIVIPSSSIGYQM